MLQIRAGDLFILSVRAPLLLVVDLIDCSRTIKFPVGRNALGRGAPEEVVLAQVPSGIRTLTEETAEVAR